MAKLAGTMVEAAESITAVAAIISSEQDLAQQ